MNPTARFYSQPSYVGGIHMPVYSGSRRQAGGNVFGAIKRAVVPSLKTAGKEMGKQALGLFTDVAGDVLKGKNLGEAVKQRAKERAVRAAKVGLKSLGKSAVGALSEFTGGPRKRPAQSYAPPPAKRRRPMPRPRPVARRAPIRRRPLPKVTKQKGFKVKSNRLF